MTIQKKQSRTCPHDLLPIKRPLEDDVWPDDMYFYNNVIKPLIPDIIRLEATGIPINLEKVGEVEKAVESVLSEVAENLANNPLMKDFLAEKFSYVQKTVSEETKSKEKSPEDFYKDFDPKNKIHRTFVVNNYLQIHGLEDKIMDEWTKKDLKLLNQFIGSIFITDLLAGNIKAYMEPTIKEAMIKLATAKADAYNKNKIEANQKKLKEKETKLYFNPGSAQQKAQFFSYLGIDSENTTKAGNPQWDKSALENLHKLIKIMLDEKGEKHGSDT